MISDARTNAPIHPGEMLLEESLEPMHITQYRLAKNISVPTRRINEIAHGKRAIIADTALRFARYFGTTERFWFNLQARYDLELATADATPVDPTSGARSWSDRGSNRIGIASSISKSSKSGCSGLMTMFCSSGITALGTANAKEDAVPAPGLHQHHACRDQSDLRPSSQAGPQPATHRPRHPGEPPGWQDGPRAPKPSRHLPRSPTRPTPAYRSRTPRACHDGSNAQGYWRPPPPRRPSRHVGWT